jgi:hypothetical protein
MFSDRSSHCHSGDRRHSRGSRSHGLGGLGCGSGGQFDDMEFGGRPSPFGRYSRSGRHGEHIGWGRDGAVRLEDTPVLRRRQGSMSELLEGIGGMNLGGGSRSPFMSRNPLRSPRGPPLFGGGRPPLDDGLFSGGRDRGSHLGPGMGMGMGEGLGGSLGMGMGMGMGMGGLVSRERLFSPRAGLLGSGLHGLGSRPGSSRASTIFDLRALDRPRMPYGPLAPRLSNYRPPYVEDYFSEMDPTELAEMEEMERRGLPFWYEDYFDDLGM